MKPTPQKACRGIRRDGQVCGARQCVPETSYCKYHSQPWHTPEYHKKPFCAALKKDQTACLMRVDTPNTFCQYHARLSDGAALCV